MSRRRTATPLAGLVVVLLVLATAAAGCTSDGPNPKTAGTTDRSAAAVSKPPAPTKTLRILVTNDDGYQAPGIDTLVQAIDKLPDVQVTVVAPATQQSGSGGKSTAGPLTITDAKTRSGHDAHAVAGTPADTIRAATEQLGLHPDLVVSGINEGQNLGPAVDLSGTVGAARAAVARHIPAVAVSAGTGNPVDYGAAAPVVTRWINEHRAAITNGTAPDQVVSFNVPSCSKGKVRGLRELPPDLDRTHLNDALKPPNCTSTKTSFSTDVAAFANGFATESVLSPKPAP